MFYAVVLEEGF